MLPLQKILVPTDFSDTASEALKYSADLANRYDAEVTLLHVYPLPGLAYSEGFVAPSPEAMESAIELINRAMKQSLERAREAGVQKLASQSISGHPFPVIVQTARDGDYDLIVMGTHGRTGLRHALLGSVTEKVVRKAHCPVLTVRTPDHEFEAP